MIRSTVIGVTVAAALSATAGYAVQDFTLDEAQTRIERLEARVAALEATIAASTDGSVTGTSEHHRVTGTVVIVSSQYFDVAGRAPFELGDACVGNAGYDAIRPDGEIRAFDGAGNVVGLGRLTGGELVEFGVINSCELSWTMDVEDADFYSFNVDHWDGPSYSRDELEAAGWQVSLSIGD